MKFKDLQLLLELALNHPLKDAEHKINGLKLDLRYAEARAKKLKEKKKTIEETLTEETWEEKPDFVINEIHEILFGLRN
jgi:hypothetical protein